MESTNRKPTEQEKALLKLLINKGSMDISDNWEADLLVSPMKDGKMGSLHLYPKGTFGVKRIFGKQISECQYKDVDGIDIIVSLYVDSNNDLFELDIWKTNFGKLISFPSL